MSYNPYENNNNTPRQDFNSEPINTGGYSEPQVTPPTQTQAGGYTESKVTPPTTTPEPDYTVDEYYKEHFSDESISADSYAKYGESYYSGEPEKPPVYGQPAYSEPTSRNTQNYTNIYSSSPYNSRPAPPKQKRQKEKKPVTRGALAAVLIVSILCSMLLGVGGGFFAANVFSSNNSNDSALTVSTSDNSSSSYASSAANLTTTEIVKKSADSVVEITTESVVTGSFSQQYIQSGAGSGVIISKDGYIVTNYHVIEGASKITVTLRDKTEYTNVKVVGTYSAGDIALLKINPKNSLSAATVGDSSKITVGDYAVAIGNPLGQLGGSVTDGIISALDREVTIDKETYNLLQTNAEISPGNSGGGLFNGNGELIGIVNAKSSSNSVEGIGFAIPVNDVVEVVSDLKKYGYVKGQIELGLSVTDVSSTAQLWMYGTNQTGVYVTSVNSGSNASKAGFRAGDIITAINGTEIKSTTELKAAVKKHKVGDKVKFTVYRSGQKGTIEMELQESTSDTATSNPAPETSNDDDFWSNDPWSIFD